MSRVDSLFSIASVIVLGFGLIVSFVAQSGFSITTGKHSFGISEQTPCYGIAALFALFAFVYSIGYIPFSRPMMQWHFWLSAGSVLLFAAGVASFSIPAERSAAWGPELGLPGTLMVTALLGGAAIFLIAQMWFVVGLARSLISMHLR